MTKKIFNLEELKDILKLKIKLANTGLRKAKKRKDWYDCIVYQQTTSTINWILDEIKSIEEEGEAL